MTVRKATMEDAETLFAWRNDQTTRLASHNTEKLEFAPYVSWLGATLSNPMKLLLIAEENGSPVGTVRVDRETGGTAELSWTVAPEARRRGVAKRMVQLVADEISALYTIRAEIKMGNEASVKVAEAAGMQFAEQVGNVLHFVRKAKT